MTPENTQNRPITKRRYGIPVNTQSVESSSVPLQSQTRLGAPVYVNRVWLRFPSFACVCRRFAGPAAALARDCRKDADNRPFRTDKTVFYTQGGVVEPPGEYKGVPGWRSLFPQKRRKVRRMKVWLLKERTLR